MRSLHLYRSTRETKNVITNRIVDTFGHLDDSLEIIVDSAKYWIAMADRYPPKALHNALHVA